MVPDRGSVIGPGCILFGGEKTEMYAFLVRRDPGLPTRATGSHPDALESRSTMSPRTVLAVLDRSREPQIRPSIVQPVTIPMIDMMTTGSIQQNAVHPAFAVFGIFPASTQVLHLLGVTKAIVKGYMPITSADLRQIRLVDQSVLSPRQLNRAATL